MSDIFEEGNKVLFEDEGIQIRVSPSKKQYYVYNTSTEIVSAIGFCLADMMNVLAGEVGATKFMRGDRPSNIQVPKKDLLVPGRG